MSCSQVASLKLPFQNFFTSYAEAMQFSDVLILLKLCSLIVTSRGILGAVKRIGLLAGALAGRAAGGLPVCFHPHNGTVRRRRPAGPRSAADGPESRCHLADCVQRSVLWSCCHGDSTSLIDATETFRQLVSIPGILARGVRTETCTKAAPQRRSPPASELCGCLLTSAWSTVRLGFSVCPILTS